MIVDPESYESRTIYMEKASHWGSMVINVEPNVFGTCKTSGGFLSMSTTVVQVWRWIITYGRTRTVRIQIDLLHRTLTVSLIFGLFAVRNIPWTLINWLRMMRRDTYLSTENITMCRNMNMNTMETTRLHLCLSTAMCPHQFSSDHPWWNQQVLIRYTMLHHGRLQLLDRFARFSGHVSRFLGSDLRVPRAMSHPKDDGQKRQQICVREGWSSTATGVRTSASG